MRVLFLTNLYPPFEGGGYGQLCQEVAEGLKQRGHSIAIVTSTFGIDFSKDREPEENVYRILNTEVDLRPFWGSFTLFFGQRRRLQETLDRFQTVLETFQPDILFVWGMWNLPLELVSRAENLPIPKIVYYLADYWPTLPNALVLHWKEPARAWYTALPKKILAKLAMRKVRRAEKDIKLRFENALCVSQFVRRNLLEAGVPLENARVIYNGICLDSFLAASKAHQSRQPSNEFALLYAGRFSPVKGIETAIEALAKLPHSRRKVTLTLLGSGPFEYVEKLSRLAKNLGVDQQVIFGGQVPREQMPGEMSRFDALIFSSVWPEPLARVVQEAMAVGLVVIGTQVGGMAEILEEGVNSLVFSPNRPDELARQIQRLAEDSSLYLRLTAAAQNTVKEKFDFQRTLNEVENYLLELVFEGQVQAG